MLLTPQAASQLPYAQGATCDQLLQLATCKQSDICSNAHHSNVAAQVLSGLCLPRPALLHLWPPISSRGTTALPLTLLSIMWLLRWQHLLLLSGACCEVAAVAVQADAAAGG